MTETSNHTGDTATKPTNSMVGMIWGTAAMALIVTAANIGVQIPINDWLTWGAFTYPISFLITDLCNRSMGARSARRVVYAGFIVAVALSIYFATPRIAIASGTAFLLAQVLDVQIFDRLRQSSHWWMPPLVSSSIASALDTALFFSIAFFGTPVPWLTLALGDYAVKMALAIAMLLPFLAVVRLRLLPNAS
ncbi:MAG: uncharacterized PurR-regulated membrane protein YhhQ (DUF165 family) [Gammaproteobacteria bacterium]|jgi:uncharacterized PurR-regulated membrane protein YhhQ (DUF165 family)